MNVAKPHMLRRWSCATAGVVAMLLGAPRARAELIDVQFSGVFSLPCNCSHVNPSQSGAAVVGEAGDQWNDFAASSASDQVLLTVNGAATGVTLSFSSASRPYTAEADYDAFTGTPWANLMQGYLVNDIQISLSGLIPDATYGFYVYDQGDDNSPGRAVTFDINGSDPQTAAQTNASSFILNNNYVYLQGVAGTSGDITIDETGDKGEADVNGFQMVLVSAPEPSTLAILLVSMLGLGMVRWRRLPGRTV